MERMVRASRLILGVILIILGCGLIVAKLVGIPISEWTGTLLIVVGAALATPRIHFNYKDISLKIDEDSKLSVVELACSFTEKHWLILSHIPRPTSFTYEKTIVDKTFLPEETVKRILHEFSNQGVATYEERTRGRLWHLTTFGIEIPRLRRSLDSSRP